MLPVEETQLYYYSTTKGTHLHASRASPPPRQQILALRPRPQPPFKIQRRPLPPP